MSNVELPEIVNWQKLCRYQQLIEGTVSLKYLPKLTHYLLKKNGKANVHIEFSESEEGYYTLTGWAATSDASMCCQRCLNPVVIDLKANYLSKYRKIQIQSK